MARRSQRRRQGVSFIDASGINSVYAFQGLVNNHVYALAADGRRTLAGTLGGLSILEGAAVRVSYTTSNSGLKHNWITAIVPVGKAFPSWALTARAFYASLIEGGGKRSTICAAKLRSTPMP